MKVTPTSKKFGKYRPGEEFELPDKTAKVFIKLGKLKAVAAETAAPVSPLTYQTRAMQAEAPAAAVHAPYGFKADGTPRLRPAPPPRKKEADAE